MVDARSGGSLVRTAVLLVLTALWMVPMFTQATQRYPYLGSLFVPMAVLSIVLGGVSVGCYFAAGGAAKTSRRSVVTTSVTLVLLSIVGAISWAPVLNAALDFGPTRTVEGDIEVIQNPGKGNASRRVRARIDGQERSSAFHPHAGFWDEPVVRNGGPAELEVGAGLFGVPWISRFSSPSEN